MIDKNTYVDLMQRWSALDSDVDELDETLYGLFGVHCFEIFEKFEELICDAITAGMNDEAEWTGYFAWEREFNLDDDCVFDINEKPIPTHTWEHVYDLIVDTNDIEKDDD